MQTSPSSDRELHTNYRVWFIEKLIINFAMPMDFVFHTFRALFQRDKSQTAPERLWGLWSGKVAKYQKLLRVKDEMGRIPDDWREILHADAVREGAVFLGADGDHFKAAGAGEGQQGSEASGAGGDE